MNSVLVCVRSAIICICFNYLILPAALRCLTFVDLSCILMMISYDLPWCMLPSLHLSREHAVLLHPQAVTLIEIEILPTHTPGLSLSARLLFQVLEIICHSPLSRRVEQLAFDTNLGKLISLQPRRINISLAPAKCILLISNPPLFERRFRPRSKRVFMCATPNWLYLFHRWCRVDDLDQCL